MEKLVTHMFRQLVHSRDSNGKLQVENAYTIQDKFM